MTKVDLIPVEELLQAHTRLIREAMSRRDAAYSEYRWYTQLVAEMLLTAQSDLGYGTYTSLAAELGTTAGALQLIVNRHKARNPTQGDG